MSLASNIEVLTEPHLSMNALGKIVKVDSLFNQLSKAERSGGTSTTTERPIPANVNAIALMQDLLKEAKHYQNELTGTTDGNLWTITKAWNYVAYPDWRDYLEQVTNDWIIRIKTVVDPIRPRRPLNQPCIACGQKYTIGEFEKRIPAVTAWIWDLKGEKVASPEQWEVTCSNCGGQWFGKEITKGYWQAFQ